VHEQAAEVQHDIAAERVVDAAIDFGGHTHSWHTMHFVPELDGAEVEVTIADYREESDGAGTAEQPQPSKQNNLVELAEGEEDREAKEVEYTMAGVQKDFCSLYIQRVRAYKKP